MSSAMIMDMMPVFLFRLLLAGILGALIGADREYRAKEAGIRTHFLVCLGSALIMMASQWGFSDVLGIQGIHVDASRIASQIVNGIGFIGAGTIMMHKKFVSGLTTAAGLWAVAGIGIAIGGGLYILGIAGSVMVLVGLELLQILTHNLKTKNNLVVFTTNDKSVLINVTNELNSQEYHIAGYSVDPVKTDPDRIKVQLTVRSKDIGPENKLLQFMQQFPEIVIEKFE